MSRNIDPNKKLLKPFVYEQQALPIDKPVAQYIRQSTDGQVKNNIQSLILQDEEMGARLSTVGRTRPVAGRIPALAAMKISTPREFRAPKV